MYRLRLVLMLAIALVPLGVSGFAAGGHGASGAVFAPGDVIVEAKDCETSIGLSMIGPHFNDGTAMRLWGDKVGPFPVKDVKDYSGVRAVGIDGFLMVGAPGKPSTGVWHSMSQCESYTSSVGSGQDFDMGWISAYIEPPEWGRDNIDHHFFVVDGSFTDAKLVEKTLKSTSFGVELNQAIKADIGWPTPNLMHGYVHDNMHGLFEWQTAQAPALPREDQTIRFWFLVHESEAVPETHFGLNTHGLRDGLVNPENENKGNGEVLGRYYPVVIDVHQKASSSGSHVVRWPSESIGTFSHSEYCHHGHPEIEQEAGHGHSEGGRPCEDTEAKFAANADELWQGGGQTEAGLFWGGYDTTITLGPDYSDRFFDVTWVH